GPDGGPGGRDATGQSRPWSRQSRSPHPHRVGRRARQRRSDRRLGRSADRPRPDRHHRSRRGRGRAARPRLRGSARLPHRCRAGRRDHHAGWAPAGAR
ncbi:MAG: hypothetical protein AVDCRST_MAG88-2228, partial [uncultured Thermomicrobiales bacterium]